MERELRDIVNKLTACVAMRYAAESNLEYIAETEVCQPPVLLVKLLFE